MPRLILKTSKDQKKKIFPLNKKRLVIGRSEDNDITLDHKVVSRHHVVIEFKNNLFFLRDNSSKNGTYVNGVIVRDAVLENKDIIKIGPFSLTLDLSDSLEPESVIISDANPFAVLQQVGKAINKMMNEDDLINFVMDLILKMIPADRGMVFLLDQITGELIIKLIKGKKESEKNINLSKTVVDMVLNQKLGVIITDTAVDPRLKDQASIIDFGIHSVMAVPMLVREEVIGIAQLDSFKGGKRFKKEYLNLFCSFSDYLTIGIEQSRLNDQIRQETRMRTNLERYHSPEVVNMIVSNLEDNGDIDFGVKEKEISILFADICGFTQMSELLDPVEVALLLNDYFSMVTEIIFDHGGTLDKYIGDAVMAIFGTPLPKEDHADCAVRTAINLQKAMSFFFQKQERSKQFKIKIGINTGKVVAGNIGSIKRLEYTVLGDSVNVASRLCDMCKPGQILMGSQTKKLLNESFQTNEIGELAVKGKEKKVLVYESEIY